MSKENLKENEFSPAPGGTSGAINYATPWNTHASPEASQNPDNFYDRFGDKNKGINTSNTILTMPKSGSVERDLNVVYSKKDVPTPDEVVTGIKYEMGQQIKKNKRLAKERVMANLRKDPHYYGKLKMLNIDDKTMMDNMNENKKHPNDGPARPKVSVNIEETKKIFTEMAKASEKKYVVNTQIVDVMKEMWQVKKERNSWKNSK